MTLLPLEQIRLDARSHASALGWIWLLYRRPKDVRMAEKFLRRGPRLAAHLWIYLHALPYMFLLFASHYATDQFFGLDMDQFVKSPFPIWLLALIAMAFFIWPVSLLIGLVLGLVFSLSVGLAFSLAFSLFAAGIFSGAAGSLAMGLVSGVFFGIIVHFASDRTAVRVILGALARLVGGLVTLVLVLNLIFATRFAEFDNVLRMREISETNPLYFGMALYLGFALGLLRIYYYPTHYLFSLGLIPTQRCRFHPVFWDDLCLLPFIGLDRLLVRFAEHDPQIGGREIDRLIDEYPSQRAAALRARVILVARRSAAATDLSRFDEILASLPAGEKGFLKETPELRRRVHEITTLQARLDTLDRPFLREPFAALLVKEIETFEQQIAGFKPPLSTEFRKAARRWLLIARRQLDVARAAVTREPTSQVFRAGDPVDRDREAFVLRATILGELERQVMLATGCPGLLIYGRRRMGKSTLLRNLEGLLPPRVHVVSLSMQEARAFTSLPDLVALISQRVAAVVPESGELPTDLKTFDRFLGATQNRLDTDDHRLLLAIDEYENLDSKIGEGALSEDLLAVIRESIQTHRRLIWAFAGSHGIDELTHAPWTSYLVSARTIEVTPFEPAETRLLLTEPLKQSSLWRASGAEPPRFEPGFWGESGIERIHAEAGGWPHLVQLVAETVVDLVNDAGGALVDGVLLERALDRAVVRGNNVFLELLERESRLPGEWDYLRAFRKVEEQPVPEDEALDRSLRRRRLVVEEDGRYRLRVPLMARWLRQRV